MPPRPSSLSMTHGPSLAPIMVRVPPKDLLAGGDRARGPTSGLSFQHISGKAEILYTEGMEPSPAHPGPPRPKTALVLIAHGSRQDEANADLYYVVEELRRRGTYPIVEASFLELAEPTGE